MANLSMNFKKHYFDPKQPGSFSGLHSFYKALREKDKISYSYIKKWLTNQDEYTLHKPIRKKFTRNRIIVYGINDTFQADLIDLQKISKQNKGNRYLLSVIDIFSKHAWVIPVKNKKGQTILDAFKKIFKENIPKRIHSDDGQEFINKSSQQYFKKLGIKFYTLKSEMKASIVERFNRTLKEKMWRLFTKNKNYKYINVLNDLVHSYNNSYHRMIKMKPSEVNLNNEDKVFLNLYGFDPKKGHDSDYTQIKINFCVGDLVRLSKNKNIFEKGYTPNWTREIFEVEQILYRNPPVYIVKDSQGEIIKGVFYQQELQKVYDAHESIKASIVKTRKNKGQIEYLVKKRGYPKSFVKWVDQNEIE